MKQLGILDSAFINLEQANTPQHVGSLGIYDPSTAPGGLVRFKQVISDFERRLNRFPHFRTRLVDVPGGVDRPYWVKDANFDVEFHLRHIALPQPGDWRQLCIQVARLHARPLDMDRPLWECYIIEGLDNIPDLPEGSFAIYTKMHHALVDGVGGLDFMTALHDLEPEPAAGDDSGDHPMLVDRNPSMAELLGRAGVNGVRNTVGMVRDSAQMAAQVGRLALKLARKELPLPDVRAPRTRFNGPVGPYRVFEGTTFPMAAFKAVKDAAGVKLNDVALAVVGGALARYLEDKGETPEGSLIATVPVNMRTRREMSGDNNQVGSIFASLHTDIRDPLERLMAIHESTEDAKEFGAASPLLDTIKAAGILPPAISSTVASVWAKRHLSRLMPVNVSTVVTNVPGPAFDLYCAGARLVQYQGLGLLTPGVALFHVVFSRGDTISLSITGDREIMPDPEFYMQCIRKSWDELQAAVSKTARKPSRKRAPSGKKRAATAGKAAAAGPTAVPSSGNTPNPRLRRKSGATAPKLKVVGG